MGWIAVVLLTIAGSAWANEPAVTGTLDGDRELSVSLVSELHPMRSEAPGRWGFDFQLSGDRVETGRLVLEFAASGRRFPTLRTREVTLRPGRQQLVFSLPEVTAGGLSTPSMLLSWESSTGVLTKLGVMNDPPVLSDRRQFAIGFVRTGPQDDRYRPAALQWSWRSGAYSPIAFDTTVVPIEPEDVSTRPLAFLSYDLVLLVGDAVRDLSPEQLEALATWVEGGGALGVALGRDIGPHSLGFLERLIESSGKGWSLQRRFDGGLQVGVDGTFVSSFHSGMGRVALYNARKTPHDHGQWQKLGAFLWGMTYVQRDEVSHSPFDRLGVKRDPRPRSEVGKVIEDLKSSDFHMIPPAVLALVGILYLVLIGPFDWWFLGRWGRRRWTWVWMPTVTVLFALFLVNLTERYFGAESSERRWVVVDVGEGGQILRAHCIELALLSRTQQVEKVLLDETYASIDPKRFSVRHREAPEPVAPIEYEGSYPFDYRIRQEVPKWSAILTLRAWLPSEHVPEWLTPVIARDLDFDVLEGAAEIASRTGSDRSERELRQEFKERLGWEACWFEASDYAWQRNLYRIAQPSIGWVPIESLIPRWPDQVRVPTTSGSGHFDPLTVYLDVGERRIEVHDEIDGSRVVIRRTFRKAPR
ncbi:MAG: hypothetical protein AAF488_03080 [Planctomycetota bacterium]